MVVPTSLISMSSTNIPAKMNALVVQGKGEAKVEQVDTPKPAPIGVLVHVDNVALNPTDWKHLDLFGTKGAFVGSDFVGTVVAKGDEDKSGIEIGTRVAGMTRGGYSVGVGSFADYVATYPQTLIRVPDNLPNETAAGLSVGGLTAYFSLFQDKHLALTPPSPTLDKLPSVDQSKKVLIWSGATSVGQFAIQLARAAGYYVIVTASLKHESYMKSLGAAEVLDYKDDKTPEKIAEAHPDLVHALDTFATEQSQLGCARALSKTQSSKLCTILPPNDKVKSVNDKVEQTFFIGYTLAGQELDFFGIHYSKEYCQQDQQYLFKVISSGVLTGLLSKDLLKPNNTAPQTGGLAAIPAGLDRMRKGEVSGEKLTYKI